MAAALPVVIGGTKHTILTRALEQGLLSLNKGVRALMKDTKQYVEETCASWENVAVVASGGGMRLPGVLEIVCPTTATTDETYIAFGAAVLSNIVGNPTLAPSFAIDPFRLYSTFEEMKATVQGGKATGKTKMSVL